MNETSDKIPAKERVSEFFEGKSVLLTGASGFVGSVLLETLLRCCPGICTIYILLRGKKGESVETRLETLLKKQIFEYLKKTEPAIFQKIYLIEGDLGTPGLGLSDKDRRRMIEDVGVVYHCAACLNFNKSLRYALTHNVLGTKYILDLCKEMEKLEVMIYTSTIACNCHLPKLKEQVYKMPFTAQSVLKAMAEEGDETLERLVAPIIKKWPNTYTFSKNVAENLVREMHSTIPTAIIRTSLIGPSWKGIHPGYLASNSELYVLGSVIEKGFLRAFYCDPDITLPYIPVDIVVNTHIVAAWGVAMQKFSPFLVVNCIRDEEDLTPRAFSDCLRKRIKTHPIPRAIMEPSITVCKSSVGYWIVAMYEHYIPAIIIDAFLYITGHKPKFYSAYRLYDKHLSHISFFLFHPLLSDNKVFKSIREKHVGEETEVFYLDIENLKLHDIFNTLLYDSRRYDWSKDKRSKEERARIVFRRTLLMKGLKFASLICLVMLFYLLTRLLNSLFQKY